MKKLTLDDFKDKVIDNLHKSSGYCGHCGKTECGGKRGNSKLPSTLSTQKVLDAINSVKEIRK